MNKTLKTAYSLLHRLLNLCLSHIGLYIIFGGLTTLINLILFLLFFHIFNLSGWISNTLAWWPSVVFAWWTNRRWIFDGQRNQGLFFLTKELIVFTSSRLFTGIIDIALIGLTVDILQWDELLMKISIGIGIVVLNYAVSRWFVFRKKGTI